MVINLQQNLANWSFLTLFGSMILYWVGTSFNELTYQTNNSQMKIDSLELNNVNDKNQTTLKLKKGYVEKAAQYGMILSNILLGLLLLIRWRESGHFPLSNLYESLMFLSWCFTGIHLVIENSQNFLGAITTPSALLTNAFATFTLPKEMQESSPLVPALQSNWLMMHVTVMVLSYAALIIGSLLSIAFLILTYPHNDISNQSNQKKLALTLDNLSYRILGIGFPFLTIGILSGAVWANEAWGSYWSWDPKETWALLTWLIFAIYLHTRISKGWQGQKPAIIASIGFFVVWICYLGVNLIGEGLHSYGWLS